MTNILTKMIGVTAVSLGATLSTVTPANAKDDILPGVGYGAVDLGFSLQNEDFEKRSDGTYLGLRYGRAFSWYRIDAEVFSNDTSGKTSIGNVEMTGLKLNGYLDWHHDNSKLVPYVTAGFGFADFDGNGVTKGDRGLNSVFDLGIGTRYFVSENTAVDLRLQRVWSDADVYNDKYKAENYEQDVVTLGVNFAL